MNIRQAADQLYPWSYAQIRARIKTGLIPAHRKGPNGTWIIDLTVDSLRELLAAEKRDTSYDTWNGQVPKVRYRLSDEDCWAQHGPVSFMAEAQVTGTQFYTVVDAAYLCPYCRQSDLLEWNGFNYYCVRCSPTTPVMPIPVSERRYTGAGFPYPSATVYARSKPDEYYATETKWYRVPAASNWPRGRNDPHVNPINEDAPRTGRDTFRRTRSKRG